MEWQKIYADKFSFQSMPHKSKMKWLLISFGKLKDIQPGLDSDCHYYGSFTKKLMVWETASNYFS